MDYWIILWVLCISFAINMCCFLIAFAIKTDVFTDITYSATFILISIIMMVWKQNFSPAQITLFILYNLWAIRTGSYLLIRIIKTKVDHRFDKMRDDFFKFGIFWILQAVSIAIISMPTAFALSIDAKYFTSSFNYYALFFIVLAVIFLVIETTADLQKFWFHVANKTQNANFIDYGLWKDSRHPNYFGEIGFWYMITGCFLLNYLLVNHQNQDWYQLLWLISPLYLNLLILKVSGIPLLEIKANQKFGNEARYKNYVAKTPCLVFIIGKRGAINQIKKLNR